MKKIVAPLILLLLSLGALVACSGETPGTDNGGENTGAQETVYNVEQGRQQIYIPEGWGELLVTTNKDGAFLSLTHTMDYDNYTPSPDVLRLVYNEAGALTDVLFDRFGRADKQVTLVPAEEGNTFTAEGIGQSVRVSVTDAGKVSEVYWQTDCAEEAFVSVSLDEMGRVTGGRMAADDFFFTVSYSEGGARMTFGEYDGEEQDVFATADVIYREDGYLDTLNLLYDEEETWQYVWEYNESGKCIRRDLFCGGMHEESMCYEYDAQNRAVRAYLRDYTSDGAVRSDTLMGAFTYDTLGRIATRTEPRNWFISALKDFDLSSEEVTEYTYDENGNITLATASVAEKNGNTVYVETTAYTYAESGNLVKRSTEARILGELYKSSEVEYTGNDIPNRS